MTFKEIASRITGISCAVFGISWDPPKLERDIAYRVVNFLEDRRVLYNPYYLESPEHCRISIIEIRKFVTEQLNDLQIDSELGKLLRAIRSSCRMFLDTLTQNSFSFQGPDNTIPHNLGLSAQMIFYSGIGELRGKIGIYLAQILVMYGIDCESELMTIVPLEKLE